MPDLLEFYQRKFIDYSFISPVHCVTALTFANWKITFRELHRFCSLVSYWSEVSYSWIKFLLSYLSLQLMQNKHQTNISIIVPFKSSFCICICSRISIYAYNCCVMGNMGPINVQTNIQKLRVNVLLIRFLLLFHSENNLTNTLLDKW